MSDTRRPLSVAEVDAAGLRGWVRLPGRIRAVFATGDFATGLALVDRIGAAAEEADHHPDVVLTYPTVTVTLASHDVGAVTARDVDLARRIDGFAAEAGVAADPARVTLVELGLDSPDAAEVSPFLAALLGGAERTDDDGDVEVVDPAGGWPTVWFQTAGAGGDDPPQRWHLDVWVDRTEARSRIDAAVAAGGELVDDSAAPSFWVLADAQGNRACVCTCDDRGW